MTDAVLPENQALTNHKKLIKKNFALNEITSIIAYRKGYGIRNLKFYQQQL